MAPIFDTILLDPFSSFALGALIPLFAAPMIRREGRASWYGALGPMYAAWMAGVFGYFFFRYPDWMFCYLVEARALPLPWLYPIFAASLIGGAAAGSGLAVRAVLERRPLKGVLLVLLGLALWGLAFALTRDQYTHVGTTLEYRAGLARPIDGVVPFKVAFSLAGIATAVPGVGLALLLLFEAFGVRRRLARERPLAGIAPPDAGGGPPLEGQEPANPGTPLPPLATTPPARLPEIVRAGRAAGEAWARWPVEARVAALRRARIRFLEAADEIASTVAAETGKPLAEAYVAEVVPNGDLFAYWANEAPRLLAPQATPLSALLYPGKRGVIERLPRGVVALISPWNYPVAIPLRTLIPAIGAGNAVVWKPSELTPRSGALVARILQAELPPGVLQVAQGDGEVGAAIVAAAPDLVCFTGSSATGRLIAEGCAKGPIPVSLELGGKDAALVLEDAELERTASGLAWGAFTNAGQNCASVERILVVRAIAEPFLALFLAKAKRLRVSGEGAEVGPLSSQRQLDAVVLQLREAREAGAQLLTGDGVPMGLSLAPQVVLVERGAGGGEGLRLVREESFGPVVAVEIVEDEEEAIARANASVYGLAASVWTRDLARGERVARRLRVGSVAVNNASFTAALPMAPWSGVGASGYGVTNSPLALDALTRPRYLLSDRSKRPELWWYPYDQHLITIGRGLAALQTPSGRSLGTALRTVRAFLSRAKMP